MTNPRTPDDALIGNRRVAALTDTEPRIAWGCASRFDSDPAFSRPLPGGMEKRSCDVTGRERRLDIRSHRDAFDTLSEERDAATGLHRGNFPQTFSMAGMINAAMRPSLSWEDTWCRA